VAIDPSRTDDDVLGALGREPGLAAIARPGAAVLILSRDGGRLLFASRAAREFRPIEAWRNGRVSDDPLREAIRALVLRAEPGPGLRFERLRLGGARLSPPTTCACRQVALPTGETGVLVVLLDAKPNLTSQRATGGPEPRVAPTDLPAEEENSGASGPALPPREPARRAAAKAEPDLRDGGNPAEAVPRLRGRGTVRFVWEADAEARFTFVSPALATAVGEDGAAIVGRRWRELAGAVLADGAEIDDLFARGETWSGRTVRWRVAKTPVGVAVDLAGTPILGPDRTVTGFRGFGLVRTDALTWWTVDEAAQAEPHDPTIAEAVGQAPDEALTEGGDTVTGEAGSEGKGGAASAPGEDARTASMLDIHARPTSPARDAILRSSNKADDENRPDSSDAGPDSVTAAIPTEVALPSWEAGRTHSPATEAEAAPPESRGGAVRPAPVAPRLSHAERSAFRDIARALGARLRENDPPEDGAEPSRPDEAARSVVPPLEPSEAVERVRPGPDRLDGRAILGRLPLGVLVYRGDDPLFANRALLEMAGHDDVESIRAAGGMARLLPRRAGPPRRTRWRLSRSRRAGAGPFPSRSGRSRSSGTACSRRSSWFARRRGATRRSACRRWNRTSPRAKPRRASSPPFSTPRPTASS
jgi:PAS domain-containing protein